MKGIVFTEFFDMVEDTFGFDMADDLVNECDLPSGGIYTAVGTYDHMEMVSLVSRLSEKSEVPLPTLLNAFGKHLMKTFSSRYGTFFEESDSVFDFLSKIEDYIHVEVAKLYPDAELPRFDIQFNGPDILEMVYHSSRGMADLAEGLIEGSIAHFGEEIHIHREDFNEARTHSKFTLSKVV
ncbi:heme NO-binding domain-containing protein [Pontibacter sp. G13]|uniref:heme NO-binding domain-containing protein n=1 Tax=Pontibacter sp. G13 TaxID=3074898 RepID=UPI00288B29E5|nr:heme NO-binding domain-containing protein [Pontibacter sp. G13]WNJ20687.1 heme NO-binding domain-containing protein [Pontibacter sp. G13]